MLNKEALINSVFRTPWHFMRWLRLIVGGWALLNFARSWNGAETNSIEYLVLAAGLYFLYKALFNTGCEVVNQSKAESKNETQTVDYEEIN